MDKATLQSLARGDRGVDLSEFSTERDLTRALAQRVVDLERENDLLRNVAVSATADLIGLSRYRTAVHAAATDITNTSAAPTSAEMRQAASDVEDYVR